MNPAFIIIILIVCVSVWFLASSLYRPIGRFICRIGQDVVDIMTEKSESEDNKDE